MTKCNNGSQCAMLTRINFTVLKNLVFCTTLFLMYDPNSFLMKIICMKISFHIYSLDDMTDFFSRRVLFSD